MKEVKEATAPVDITGFAGGIPHEIQEQDNVSLVSSIPSILPSESLYPRVTSVATLPSIQQHYSAFSNEETACREPAAIDAMRSRAAAAELVLQADIETASDPASASTNLMANEEQEEAARRFAEQEEAQKIVEGERKSQTLENGILCKPTTTRSRAAAADLVLKDPENTTTLIATQGQKEEDQAQKKLVCEKKSKIAENGMLYPPNPLVTPTAAQRGKTDAPSVAAPPPSVSEREDSGERHCPVPSTPRQSQSQVGAFAVAPTRAQDEEDLVTQEMQLRLQSTAEAASGDPLTEQASGDPLIEARLVQEESQKDLEMGEVVIAETVQKSKRIQIIVAVSAVTIAGMLAIILGLVLGGKEELDRTDTPLAGPTLDSSGLFGTTIDDNTTTSDDSGTTCFTERSELFDAVNDYLQDRGSNSSVAQEYGWPIGSWCVSKVKDFSFVFKNKELLEDVGDWNMSGALEMDEMIRGNKNVSAELGLQRWDTSNIRSLKALFMNTDWVEPMLNLSSWNISNCRSLNQLFRLSKVEEPGVKHWDTSSVTTLGQLATDNPLFNEDLGLWDTSSVKTAVHAFSGASNFNKDISNWDTQRLEIMRQGFFNSGFNQDISSWNVTALTDLRKMFKGASNFSQNLCAWGALLPPDAQTTEMFKDTACPNQTDSVIPRGPFCFNCG